MAVYKAIAKNYTAPQAQQPVQEPECSPAVADAYERIDKFLRNNLGDDDYAEYSFDLELVSSPQVRQPAEAPFLTDKEILEMADDGVFLGNVKEIARAVESVVRKKAGLK